MNKKLFLFFSLFILCGLALLSSNKFVVVIDAGHGGKDPGAVRGTYKEKEINLGVALALGQLIEKNMTDVKVVYTRKTDVFVDLDKRAQIANKAKANLFISIHTNATDAKSTSASGADTYILGLARSAENLAVAKRENSVILYEDDYQTKYEGFDPNKPESNIIFEFMTNKYMEQSLQFANYIQRDFKNIARRVDRGVRQAGFLVLRKSSMPSVLIELGFINNTAEAKYLSSNLGQRAMATSIYSGFKRYKQDFDKKRPSNGGKGIEKNIYPEPEVVELPIVEDSVEPNSIEIDTPSIVNNSQVDTKSKNGNQNVVDSPKTIDIAKTNPSTQVLPKETPKATIQPNEVEYRIQILVADKKLPDNSPQLKGLKPVNFYREGNAYKYTYGSTTNWNEIQNTQKQVRTKFKDAFIVKFKNGERVK